MSEAIEARRKWRGLSPTELARESGVTLQGLGPIRAGYKRNYLHKSKVGLARALWWPDDAIDRLMDGEDAAAFETVRPDDEIAAKLDELDRLIAEVRELTAKKRPPGAPRRGKSTRPNGN